MSFSAAVRERVYDRSGSCCERKLPTGQRCLAPGAEYHHIILKGLGGRHGRFKKMADSEENCMMVCLGCHRERHEGPGWNEDAAGLVPGEEVRELLRRGRANATGNE